MACGIGFVGHHHAIVALGRDIRQSIGVARRHRGIRPISVYGRMSVKRLAARILHAAAAAAVSIISRGVVRH